MAKPSIAFFDEVSDLVDKGSCVGIICLGSCKVFDMILPDSLIRNEPYAALCGFNAAKCKALCLGRQNVGRSSEPGLHGTSSQVKVRAPTAPLGPVLQRD